MKKLIIIFVLSCSPVLAQTVISQASILQFTKQLTTPNNPPTNSAYLFLNSSGNLACLTPTGGSCLSGGGGSGTVTSIATTSPITGGTITTTGTIACATCTTSAASLTNNQVLLGAGSQGMVASAIASDNGTTFVYSGTGGVDAGGGTLTSGTAGTTGGSLTMAGVTSGTVTFTAPAVAGTRSNAVTLSNSLTVSGPQVTISAAAGGNGVLALSGNTSGTATLTAPATAGTSTNPIVISNVLNGPLGAVGTVAYGNSTNANSGLYFVNGTSPAIAAAGAAVLMVQGAAVRYSGSPSTPLCWTSGDATAACDTGESRVAADVIALGNGSGADETALIRWNTCKISTPITLSTTTTICTWTLPASAKTWSYRCDGMYQTNTSAITLLLGTQFGQSPTNSTHSAIIWSAASTQTFAQATNTGTTATTTMTGVAPSANTATPWEAHGTFTGSATSGTFVIYGTASTATDAQINGGSSCELY